MESLIKIFTRYGEILIQKGQCRYYVKGIEKMENQYWCYECKSSSEML